jgi:L-ribulose-5-phosphate 3-epimerase
MFKLSAITDEIAMDFEQAVEMLAEWEMSDVELHTLWGTSVETLTGQDVERIRQILAAYDMRIRVLDSTVFLRCPLFDGVLPGTWSENFHSVVGTLDQHMAWLEHTLETAQQLNVPLVRVFGFWRDGETTDAVVERITERLQAAVELAAKAEVTLALENCPHTFLGPTRNALRVLRAVDSPWLRLLWDPSNAYRAGEHDVASLAGEAMPYLAHLHVKGIVLDDLAPRGRRYVPVAEGAVDFGTILSDLLAAAYEGGVALEPHYSIPPGGIESAGRESYLSLLGILDNLPAEHPTPG